MKTCDISVLERRQLFFTWSIDHVVNIQMCKPKANFMLPSWDTKVENEIFVLHTILQALHCGRVCIHPIEATCGY